MAEGISINEISRWWEVLSLIARHLTLIRRPRKCHEWSDYLKLLLENLFSNGNPGEWEWEYKTILEERWQATGKLLSLHVKQLPNFTK